MKKFVLLAAVAVVLVSVLGVYYLIESSNAPNIEGPSSGYLVQFQSSFESKIFLVSTDNPRYGVYEGVMLNGVVVRFMRETPVL